MKTFLICVVSTLVSIRAVVGVAADEAVFRRPTVAELVGCPAGTAARSEGSSVTCWGETGPSLRSIRLDDTADFDVVAEAASLGGPIHASYSRYFGALGSKAREGLPLPEDPYLSLVLFRRGPAEVVVELTVPVPGAFEPGYRKTFLGFDRDDGLEVWRMSESIRHGKKCRLMSFRGGEGLAYERCDSRDFSEDPVTGSYVDTFTEELRCEDPSRGISLGYAIRSTKNVAAGVDGVTAKILLNGRVELSREWDSGTAYYRAFSSEDSHEFARLTLESPLWGAVRECEGLYDYEWNASARPDAILGRLAALAGGAPASK